MITVQHWRVATVTATVCDSDTLMYKQIFGHLSSFAGADTGGGGVLGMLKHPPGAADYYFCKILLMPTQLILIHPHICQLISQ